MTTPDRPRVICHMMTSTDGRIVVDRWPLTPEGRREYERTHATFGADAWMCGRVTMEPFAGGVRPAAEVAAEVAPDRPRADHRAPDAGPTYAIAVDAAGRLAWEEATIDGDHVIAVLTERVSDAYLERLRDVGVSYVLAGRDAVDLAVALAKLAATFGVRTLLLEGGGRINGAMLRAGLIDEVSVLVAPVADGAIGTPALFDVDDPDGDREPRRLALLAVERRTDDVLWLHYRVVPAPG